MSVDSEISEADYTSPHHLFLISCSSDTVEDVTKWNIETTLIDPWLDELDDSTYDTVVAALEFLEEQGPGCGRPFVDTVSRSRHANMKELRPRGGHIRILFAFDPRRTGIMLLAGDKTGKWNKWYKDNIPRADARFDAHLQSLDRPPG